MSDSLNVAKSEIGDLSYDEPNRILHIKLHDWADMNVQNTRRHYKIINELTKGQHYYALIDAEKYFSFENTAFQITTQREVLGNRLASAHYNSNFANRLNVIIYNSAFSPPIPVRYFNSKGEALSWILELKNKGMK